MPGEIADMMLDGTLCEGCGEYMGGAGEGFPRYCSDECAKGRGREDLVCTAATRRDRQPSKPERARWRRNQTEPLHCPYCGFKRKSPMALSDHMRDSHLVRMTLEPISPQEK